GIGCMADTERPRKIIAGRYEVLRPLGRGGMGKVFLVRDRTTGQRLALKMLRSQWQSRKAVVARFVREIETARKLDHPCIVKIHDACYDDDLLFYTMEYIEGKSLRHWMRQRTRLEFGSVVRVLCLVAHALEHAHRVTIHRDLSPENIMVLADGSVRLLDFGLAKVDDPNQGLTMVGSSLGKMQYIAPEQRKNAAQVDPRTDLYPLGVMFFEMLSGQLPNGRDRLTTLCPELPPETDAFVERAIAADPEARFQSAREFRHALLALYDASKRPCAAPPPPGLLARLRAWWRGRQ
ncbi:MAG TPA: serine/threonine-protein kinase, partial [Candidatus Hydrogenedentes bacterium]|nr:serine/threonine-protein kinase [Candidatus Hydrogenedentota bacterium]